MRAPVSREGRVVTRPPVPSVDQRRLEALWRRWQPERPELLIRLRAQETARATR
jgi:hypothetical protein